MIHTIQVPAERSIFSFGVEMANLPVDLQVTFFEDEAPHFALSLRTLTQAVVVFLTAAEVEMLTDFFTAPELAPGHCSDC